ncbi:MAG: RcnB family protein [Mesorhizobium sp.]|nr:RcnB family protein [Mesorhizobium sp.]MBL8577019.1 RcnB family protein [Mesorhizobium sp.]
MKRLVLTAIALSMLAVPVAQAQAGPRYEQPRYEQPRYEYGQDQWKKKRGYDRGQKYGYDKRYQAKKRWAQGNRVPDWQRKHVVKDYYRYGLRRPAYGQQWVRVDNDFLLISIASGIIGGIIASQY